MTFTNPAFDGVRAAAEKNLELYRKVMSRRGGSALRDIVIERQRQVDEEGWHPDHDDQHDNGALARAAACYAVGSDALADVRSNHMVPVWPIGWEWKDSDPRRNLVKAAALILAEIERLDRTTSQGEGTS